VCSDVKLLVCIALKTMNSVQESKLISGTYMYNAK
jgi:hypothetical protein